LARFLGIDWDNNQLHVVAVSTGRGGVRVERAVALQDDFSPAPGRAEAVGQRLREHLRTAGIAAAPALVALGRDRVILKEIRYPAVPPAEEPAIVRFQAAKELTESGDNVVIDYAPRGNGGSGGDKTAFAFAVRRDVPLFLQAVCRAAGLKLLAVAPRGYGVAAALKRAAPAAGAPEAAQAVLTVGGAWADFSVVRGDTLLFSRSLPADGNLAAEARRNLALYNGQAPAADKAQAVHVAAGDSPRLLDELRQALTVPVHALDPLARDEGSQPQGERGGYTAAVGLTAAWVASRKLPVNFIQPKEPVKQSDPETKRAVQVGALVGVIALGLVVICWMILSNREQELANLHAHDAELTAQLSNLAPDAKHIQALKDWTATNVSWLDVLYDVTGKFPWREGFRLTEFQGGEKPQAQAVFAKTKVKDQYAGRMVLSGEVPVSDERLVDSLKTQLSDANHRPGQLSLNADTSSQASKTKKDRKLFGLPVDVVSQPSVRYTTRFTAPAPPKTPRQPSAFRGFDEDEEGE
jgi:Tfp pilus assembly PilM family ATPase